MKGIIIEGEYSRLPPELYDDFRNDYLTSSLTSDEVRRKYGLSDKEYSQLTKPIREELGIRTRPYPNSRHFYLQGKRWQIVKSIDGERVFFGSLPIAFFSESEGKLSGFHTKYTYDRNYYYSDTLKNIFGSVGKITSENKEYY